MARPAIAVKPTAKSQTTRQQTGKQQPTTVRTLKTQTAKTRTTGTPAAKTQTAKTQKKVVTLEGKANAQPNGSGIAARRLSARKDSTSAYKDRREEIAAAAARVFNRKGYVGTTIAAVAKEMKTDRASLYYYISSKEELFDEVVREVSDANVAAAEDIQASSAPAPEKLRLLINSLMQSYATNYPLLYVYIRENLSHVTGKRSDWSNHMRSLNHRYDEAITSIVAEGMAEGTLKAVAPAQVVAFGIIGMVGWTNRWFDPKRTPYDATTVAKGFADMVLGGLVAED
jgi:TetR/AcrR family transcriptional regulator, cholesterol catabolism regulator